MGTNSENFEGKFKSKKIHYQSNFCCISSYIHNQKKRLCVEQVTGTRKTKIKFAIEEK